MSVINSTVELRAKAQQKALDLRVSHAKQGLVWALGSGITWGMNGIILGIALAMAPFVGVVSLYAAPLVGATLNEGGGSLLLFFYNLFSGKFLEYGRTLRTKPGMLVCLGALCAGPIAMSGYLVGINMAGPMYTLAITTAFPAVGAIFAAIFLKEKIMSRVWFGIILTVVGAIVVGYAPPTGNFPHFYLGLIFATLATFGWAAEGVIATYGMDMVDPEVSSGIREATSFVVYLVAIIPLFGALSLFGRVFVHASLWWLLLAGVISGMSYLCYYKGLNMTGAARTTGLNITYALWGVFFGWLIMHSPMTPTLIAGSVIITLGAVLIVANPKELINIREV